MRTLLAAIASVAILVAAQAAQAADQAIIVLDASGSMWGQIGGQPKIAIARQTLKNVLNAAPPGLEIGLMAYGHRDKGSCKDIELIVPPGPGTAGAIAAAADALSPKGKTPLTDAVRQAAEDLRYTEDKATVILITDGLETCDADPCAVANELKKTGVDFTADVIGFGLSSEEGGKIACLATNTGGKYFSAGDAAKLGEALKETVAEVAAQAPPAPAPEQPKSDKTLKVTARPSPDATFSGADSIRYDIFKGTIDQHDPDPITTAYGEAGGAEEFALPAGTYLVIASRDIAGRAQTVEVVDGKESGVDIVMDAGFIRARPMATETEPVVNADAVRWDVTDAKGLVQTNYGPTDTILVNAGTAGVKATLGAAVAEMPVTVEAGKTEDVDVILGAGHLVLSGKRSADTKETDSGIRWDVAGTGIDTLTSYGGDVTFDLPAGDYHVKATLGEAVADVDVSVSAGKTVEKEVIVATGRVVAHALFATGGPTATEGVRFDVLSPQKGADGEHETFATAYNDASTFDLPPGQYLMRATADAASADMGFELKPGPPLEVSVVLNAGLLAITAPGASRLDVLGAKKDIYGKQASVVTSYNETWQVTLPAGEYVVKATAADGSEKSAPANVKPGERTEVTVP